MKKKRFAAILICVVLLASLALPAFGAQRTVRVGWYAMDGLQQSDGNGGYSGYNYDYLEAVAQYTGWDYEFVSASWSECLAMLRSGRIDVLGTVKKTDEREEYYDYTSMPAGINSTELAVLSSADGYGFEDFDSFRGLRVASTKDSARDEALAAYAKSNGFSYTITAYANDEAMYQALESGKADAVLKSSAEQRDGCRVIARFDSSYYYFATTKGNAEVLSGLNYGLEQLNTLDPGFGNKLHDRWFKRSGAQASLTPGELAFVRSAGTITYLYDPARCIVEYRDKGGNVRGIIPDVLSRISEQSGLVFDFVPLGEFDGDKSAANVLCAADTDYALARENSIYLTAPLISAGVARISKSPDVEPRTAAVCAGQSIEKTVGESYPELSFTQYSNALECVEAVASGKADCAFLGASEANYCMAFAKYGTLCCRTIGLPVQNISLGVSRASDPQLYTILSKCLASISDDELSNIMNDNLDSADTSSPSDVYYRDPALFFAVSAAMLALLTLVVLLVIRHAKDRKRNEELNRASAARAQYLSAMGDELRTPMNGIIGMTLLALDQDNPPTTAGYLQKINMSGNFLLGLVNDIVDMTRVESGNIELKYESYPMPEFAEYLDTVIQPLCESKSISFKPSVAGMEYTILTDKLRLNQIFFNLISNSVKFTAAGGYVELRGEVKPPRGDSNALGCEFTVRDNGSGMSQEFLDGIFSLDSGKHSESELSAQGTGLGLSLAKKLVERLGGTISAKVKAIGVEYRISLSFETVTPKATEAPAQADAEPAQTLDENGAQPADVTPDSPSERPKPLFPRGERKADGESAKGENAKPAKKEASLKKKNVLLVEDHPVNAQIALSLLEAKGVLVTYAENGKKALESFISSRPGYYDAILMDTNMPVMDGIRAAKAIRSLDRPDALIVPIIAMTANAFDEDIQKCEEAGMNAHISKPIDQRALYDTLTAQIKQAKENAETEAAEPSKQE